MPCVGDNKLVYNIQELPDLLNISSGDKFIIETLDGPYLVDYDNIIIELSQTTFEDVFEGHTTEISELSAKTNVSSISGFEDIYDNSVVNAELEILSLISKLESYVGVLSSAYYSIKEDYKQTGNTCVDGDGVDCCLIKDLN